MNLVVGCMILTSLSILMSADKHILIYASQYEHINRGCMENLLQRFSGFSIKLTLLLCDSSHRACYLNKCLANAGIDFIENDYSACQVCYSNQSVFQNYAHQLGISCNTIVLPSSDINDDNIIP